MPPIVSSTLFVSVVIPCFNEEERIRKSLPEIFRALRKFVDVEIEVVVVDDGSTDRTFDCAQSVLAQGGIRHVLHSFPKNFGKGAAVKKGVELSSGTYIVFFDADLSTSLNALDKLFVLLKTHSPAIVIGSRHISGSRVQKEQNFFRKMLGAAYRAFALAYLHLKVSDITCGFKCFRADAAKKIFIRSRITRWGFDAEVLYIASKMCIPIYEIPVEWKNDERSKVRLSRDIISSFCELMSIKKNDRNNIYD